MTPPSTAACLLLVAASLHATPAAARTWHVAPAVTTSGDGTADKPFKTLERALQDAAAGDIIKVQAGAITLPSSSIPLRVRQPRLVIRGGYDAKFDARDPWNTPTVLQAPWDYTSPLIEVLPTATGATLDGLTLDGGTGNSYGRGMGTSQLPRQFALLRVLRADGVVIRNCAFFNGTAHAVSASVKTELAVEHVLAVNHRVSAITLWGIQEGARARIMDSTLADTWAEKPSGGAGHAVDVQPHVAVTLERNVVAHAQGACFRLAMGVKAVVLKGNHAGGCAEGTVLAHATSGPATPHAFAALGALPGVEAAGNQALAADVFAGTPVAQFLAVSTATRPDGGAAPQLPPHAPRADLKVENWVGKVTGAGVQPGAR